MIVHVPRDEILEDALAELPSDQQVQLRRGKPKLAAYLASRDIGDERA